MKHRFQFFIFLTLTVLLPTMPWSQNGTPDRPLPKVHIIATGGTIAGTSNDIGYDAGKVTIETILQAVPELTRYAELGSLDNFLERELGLTADEKRILRNKFLEKI